MSNASVMCGTGHMANVSCDTRNISAEIESFRYVGITIGLTNVVLGTLGNLLTIVVFSKSSSLRLSFNHFILSLAMIDLFTSILMMPFNVAGYMQMNWLIGGPDSFTASLQAFSYFCCGYTSIACLMAITVNRFISIQYPESYKTAFSARRVKVAIALSWIIAPAFLLPFLIGSISEQHRTIGWRKDQLLCTFVRLPDGWMTYMQIIRVIFQFLPIILMVLAYLIMFWKLRKSSAEANVHSQLPWEGDKTTPPVAALLTTQSGKQLDLSTEEAQIAARLTTTQKLTKERRLLYVSAVLCGAFTLLFVPSLIVNLIPGSGNFDSRIHMAASNITWFNSCINPFIYAIVNPKFRTEYKIFIKYFWLKLSCRL